jgi:WD40 repeat protein
VFDAIYSPEGRIVVIAFESDSRLALGQWDLTATTGTGTVIDLDIISTSCLAREAHLASSSDGSLLAVSIGKSVILVDRISGDIIDERDALSKYAGLDNDRSIAFPPLGTGYILGDHSLEGLDLDNPDVYTTKFQGFSNPIRGGYTGPEYDEARTTGLADPHIIEYSPDGRLIAVGGGRFIGLWDSIAGYRFQFLLGYDFVQSISFAPDSQSLVFVSDNGKLYWWDISQIWEIDLTTEPILVIDGGVGVKAAYSPDGKSLAIGMSDGSIQFRDSASFQLIHEIHVHSGRVTSVRFSPNGRQLLSSSYDGSVGVWDVTTLLSKETDIASAAVPGGGVPPLTDGQQLTLTSIHMVDGDSGWAIDSAGHLLRTSNGGTQWRDVSPTDMTFSDEGLFILDGSTAWVTPTIAPCYQPGCPPASLMEGTVWRTVDGGQSWEASQPFLLGRQDGSAYIVPYYRPATLKFIDSNHGWLLVSVDHRMRRDFYRLLYSSDGGNSWSRLIDETNGPPFVEAFNVEFLDTQRGFLAGEGPQEYYDTDHLFVTDNAGESWEKREIGEAMPWRTCSIEAFKLQTLSPSVMSVAAKVQRIQYQTTDCTPTLVERHALLTIPRSGYLWDPWRVKRTWNTGGFPYFMNDTLGWVLVIPGSGLSNTLQHTQDGGVTWQVIRRVAWEEARFSFVDERTGWAIATSGEESALVHTTNGGESWEEIIPVSIGPSH